jgi:hypothetical protein
LSVDPTFAARYTESVSKDAISGEIVGAWFAMIALRGMDRDELLINSVKTAFIWDRRRHSSAGRAADL